MADTAIVPGLAPPAAGGSGKRLVEFLGRRGALFGILLVNTLLGAITLGIYRFWARTRLRQFFWHSVEVDGDPLEYTGRGMELFIGFLIVVAILVPLSMAYSVLSLFLEAVSPDVLDALNFVYFLSLLWLARYAYFRARRYRLARTFWRGIRAGQDGSAAGYAWLWLGYAVVSVITLGWLTPWMTAALQEYEVEKARFGVENFRYAGSGKGLLRAWAPCGALWTLAAVAAVLLSFSSWPELQRLFALFQDSMVDAFDTENPAAGQVALLQMQIVGTGLVEIYAIVIVALLVSIPFYFVYRISALRYMFQVSSLSEAEFGAEFSGWRIVGNWILYFLVLVLLIVGLIAMFSGFSTLATVHLDDETAQRSFEALSTLAAILLVVALLMLFPMTKFLLFHFPVIRHVASTLTISDVSSLDRIVQSTKDDPRFGEGLASAMDFDVGGF